MSLGLRNISFESLIRAVNKVPSTFKDSDGMSRVKTTVDVALGLLGEMERLESSSSEGAVFRHRDLKRSFVLFKNEGIIEIFVRHNKTNEVKYQPPDKLIGSGTFKKICKATDIFKPDRSIAIGASKKKINFELTKLMSAKGISNEVYACITYVGKNGDEKYMVLQEHQDMDIITLINDHITSEDIKYKIALGMLSKLAELHRLGFIHGDIKADNFLFTEALQKLSLIDFDFTITDEESKKQWIGNYYIPPELAKPTKEALLNPDKLEEDPNFLSRLQREILGNLSSKVDIWSLAHIFVHLFKNRLSNEFKRRYFSKYEINLDQYFSITSSLEDNWLPEPSTPLEGLIKDMFNIDPTKRPSAQAALNRLQEITEQASKELSSMSSPRSKNESDLLAPPLWSYCVNIKSIAEELEGF
ncbi:MAG: hypothetical protein HZB76_02695 [Chlamydiae bacterium]|nr:hypothetical protein [Chlamydiota bacterium]